MTKRTEYSLALCSLLSLVLSCHHGTSDAPGTETSESTMRPATEPTSREQDKPNSVQAGGQQTVPYSGEGFRLMLPDNVSVKRTEAIDYIRYAFTSNGKGILDAYVGNFPTFLFDDRAMGPESITQLNGLPCKRAQAQRQDGTVRTELLIRLPRNYGWPIYIHFWYSDRESQATTMAEGIIASVIPQEQGAELSSFPDPGGPDFPPARRRSEDIIADMEQELEEMKKQQGMTEEVKRLEAELKMRKDFHRQAQEISRTPWEERKQEVYRQMDEQNETFLALMEQDLAEMKKRQGMTEEVKEFEAWLAQEKLRLLQQKKDRESGEKER